MFETIIEYLKIIVTPKVERLYNLHKDEPDYKDYWETLKNELQEAIKLLEVPK